MVVARKNLAVGTVIVMLAASVVLPTSTPARERREAPGGRKAMVVGQWAYERLERAHEALAAEDYEQTLEVLEEMRDSKKLNENEQALMWQTYAYVYSAQEKYAEAAESFEKCLETNGLPEETARNTRYNLAQLYLMEERYDEAIPLLLEWFETATNPSPSAYYALAVAYLNAGDREKSMLYAKQAVAKSDEPKEPWLQLLLSFHLEDREYGKAATILEDLVARFPKKIYWMQLSAAYSALDDPKKALAVLELANLQNFLDAEGELVHLAQLYFYNQIPHQAAQVLEDGLDNGIIQGDEDSWALLANSWLYAKERERALEPLTRAAALAKTGDLYLQLAQLHLEREDWAEAVRALEAAFQKGGLKQPATAHLMLGIANAGAHRWEAAEKSLDRAKSFEETQKAATAWLSHLQRERLLWDDRPAGGSESAQLRDDARDAS